MKRIFKSVFFCWGFFLILMPILFVQVNCKSPAEPSNHEVFAYRYNVKVIYERNPNDITNPECKNDIEIRYYLYDPSGAGDTGGTINPERLSENVFVGYLERVFIHSGDYQRRHYVWVLDPKLYDGQDWTSAKTPDGLSVEGSYAISITGFKYYYKMSAENSGVAVTNIK